MNIFLKPIGAMEGEGARDCRKTVFPILLKLDNAIEYIKSRVSGNV